MTPSPRPPEGEPPREARPYALSLALPATCLLALAGAAVFTFRSSATAQDLPPPPREAGPVPSGLQTAVFAGGCFWGVEAVFEHVKGVRTVTSGYAGGARADANYRRVASEKTGHAEAVRIVYDPEEVRYGQLLHVFFAVAHDPTQLNRQTPDVGRSYRSALFPQTPLQRQMARSYIAQLDSAGTFGRKIATKLEQGAFYKAEDVHQDFARKNPRNAYIVRWDKPKVARLKREFPALYTR